MENCKEKKIEEYVRSIPDFPEEGVIFRDVTSILQDADGFALAVDSMQKLLEGSKVDVIVGTESRGFIFGAPIAYNLHKPLVLVRKKGKLPCETIAVLLINDNFSLIFPHNNRLFSIALHPIS